VAAAEVQGAAVAFEAPGGQHRLDQLPAGIRQITWLRAAPDPLDDLSVNLKEPQGGVLAGI
jgi:hypothetical protein